MFSVISRALTPAPRARRTLALTLALALGAVPVTSAVSAQPAAAEPAVNLQLVIKAQQPKDDPAYLECVATFVGTMNATPGVWAVCHGYLDSEEYTVTRRHSTATVTRGQLVRMLYRMAGSPTVKNLPKTAGMTGSSTRMTTPPATPSPRSSTAPQVAPTVPHACARSAARYVPKLRRLSSSRPKTVGQPARSAPTPKTPATVTAQ